MSVLLQAGEQELETLSFEHHVPQMLDNHPLVSNRGEVIEPKFNNVLCI